MRRVPWVVVGLLLVLGACTPAPAPVPGPTAPTPPEPSPTAIAGGCGDTRLWTGAAPGWTADAGVGQLPYALSHEGNVYAGLFANPLRAGATGTGPNNKILWIVREPRDGQPLRLTLHRLDGTGETVTHSEPANSGPGEIYPSIVDVPAAGCWAITAEWAGHRATLELPWT